MFSHKSPTVIGMSSGNADLGLDLSEGGLDTSVIFMHDRGSEDMLSDDSLTKVMASVWPSSISGALLVRWQNAARDRIYDAMTSPYGDMIRDSIIQASNLVEESLSTEKQQIQKEVLDVMRESGWAGTDDSAPMWAALRSAVKACAIMDCAAEPFSHLLT